MSTHTNTQRVGLDRLTSSDIFLMLWDDYGWSSDIGGLAILDGTRLLDDHGQLRIDELRTRIEARLHLVPRFRQLLYRPRFGLGWPLWVDSPAFDIADHVRIHPLTTPQPLPGGGDPRAVAGAGPGDHFDAAGPGAGEAELLAACAELAQRPMDQTRPVWELWLLPGLPANQVGAYLKLHHALADGGAALATFAALLDLTPDAPASPTSPPAWTPRPIPSTAALARDNLRRRGHELGRAFGGLTHPRRTVRAARRVMPAWREVLTDEHAPKTSLNTPVTRGRRLAVTRSRVGRVKDVAHAHSATVNDVILAAVAGGLRDLLASRGEPLDRLNLRAMVTISLHDEERGQARGNKPGWMMVSLPLGEPDPVRRLTSIAGQTRARKHQPRPEAGTGIFRFLAGQRLWYRAFPGQRAVNLVVTNVPGPPVPLYLAGARLLEVFPVMCVMGNLTLVVGALSYDGQLNVTAIADGGACLDVEVFNTGLRHALEALTRHTDQLSHEHVAQARPAPTRRQP